MRLDDGAVQPILFEALGNFRMPNPRDVSIQHDGTIPTHENLRDCNITKTKKAAMASIIRPALRDFVITLVWRCWSQRHLPVPFKRKKLKMPPMRIKGNW
jgi:hypothetical protein